MRINRLLWPITVLGPGRRAGVWVQGCDLACPGCASVDTWDPLSGREVAVEELADALVGAIREHDLTGLTVTGGEPAQQPNAVAELVRSVWAAAPEVDVMIFTGYDEAVARKRAPALFEVADAIVAGPYRQRQLSGGPWCASDNQHLLLLTDRARDRYAGSVPETALQLAEADGDLVLVGLPRPGDLDRWRDALAARGVTLDGGSWIA